MGSKLISLLTSWPANTVRLVGVLRRAGYSAALVDHYRRAGWLQSIGPGAVIRKGDQVNYLGALYALQTQANLDVHLGGLSALELRGRAHFLRKGRPNIHIFGTAAKLPSWTRKADLRAEIQYHSTKLFPKKFDFSLMEHNTGSYKILISGAVSAMLELLYLTPMQHSFEEGRQLMEGLAGEHPQAVERILMNCNSIKAKRLFLLLAEACGHRWLNQLDVTKFDLGSGRRSLIRGGVYNKKYKLVIPRNII